MYYYCTVNMYNVLDYLLLKFNPEKLLIDFPWVLNVCFILPYYYFKFVL